MVVLGGLGSITRVGARRGALHRPDRGAAGVRPVPDGHLLAPPHRHHDRAAAGDPGPSRVRYASSRGGGASRRAGARRRQLRRAKPWRCSSCHDVTMRFGGLVAVNEPRPGRRARAALRPDRPQRRGQDDGLQRHHRRLHADVRAGSASTASRSRGSGCGRITRRGIARTFQNIRLFGELTVLENVKVAFHCRQAADLAAAVLRTPTHHRRRGARGPGEPRAPEDLRPRRPARTRRRETCPTAASGGSRSRARWRRPRGSCCSTSRRPG